VTAAASVHVRTALGDKAFDEAPSRGLALTLGDAVAYAEKSSARRARSDQRNGSIRAIDVIILQQGRMSVVGPGCVKTKNGLPANFCFWGKVDVRQNGDVA
jgi:hypothetical protein